MARRKAPHIGEARVDQLLAGAAPNTAFESEGLLDAPKMALAKRALNADRAEPSLVCSASSCCHPLRAPGRDLSCFHNADHRLHRRALH